MTEFPKKIDLHMHSTVSDGTDTPSEIISRVKEKGIDLFSVTDHDAVAGALEVKRLLAEEKEGPAFIPGVEFSARDGDGKYHILGYHYDTEARPIHALVEKGHGFRIRKVEARIAFLKEEFGFTFSEEDLRALFAMDNPGKPHIGNMMVKYGYAETRQKAIHDYMDKMKTRSEYLKPQEVIEAILASDGIPVLAHPSYGSGEEIVVGEEMRSRLQKLIGFGLAGVEAFYSGFTEKLQEEMLSFAKEFSLYVTAGSDYHGKNKMVPLGDTNLEDMSQAPEGLIRFLREVL